MDASFFTILSITLPVFLLAGLGVFLRRSSLLPAEGESSLMRVVVGVFYPALILQAVGPSQAVDEAGVVAAAIAVGFLTIVVGFFVAYLCGPLFGLQVGTGRRTFAFSNGIYNYGYMPIPLVIGLFGTTDGTLAVLFVHNIGVDLAFWTVGVLILQGSFRRESFRRVINPPAIALVVALGLNYTGLYGEIPGFFRSFLGYLADIAVPFGIILAGCSIGGLLRTEIFRRGWAVLGGSCLLRLAILPAGFLAVAIFVPLPDTLKSVVVIQAAMPAGLFPVVVTRFFGGSEEVAVRVAVGTMVVSVLTTPLWLDFGMRLTGVVPGF